MLAHAALERLGKGILVDIRDCRFDGEGRFRICDYPTNFKVEKAKSEEYAAKTAANVERMAQLQDKLYAEGREGLVILVQAMDAAGKDSTIKRVMSGVNPQGVDVYSFKQPSHEELAHDYLWRAVRHLPERGKIALFNRSYYEDVLVVRVHQMQQGYKMPKRCTSMDDDDFFGKRYRQIRDFEEYLWENGYRVLKIFLNVGRDEQRKRFLERIDNPAKNWKFSDADLRERALWPQYMKAYEAAIDGTATKHAPWYVIPADQKWFARWLISEAIVQELEEMDPHYPEVSDEQRASLEQCRLQLTAD